MNQCYYHDFTDQNNVTSTLPDFLYPDSPSSTFYKDGGIIFDAKAIVLGDQTAVDRWNFTPNGWTLHTYSQELLIFRTSPCGLTDSISLGTINIRAIKVSATQFKIEKY